MSRFLITLVFNASTIYLLNCDVPLGLCSSADFEVSCICVLHPHWCVMLCLSGTLNGLLYICVLYYFLLYLHFILYFSDMFYIQWFCNPLDLLNENEIQYSTMYILLYSLFTDTVWHSATINVVKVKVKLALCMPWGHTAPFIHNFSTGWGWGVSCMPLPFVPWETAPIPEISGICHDVDEIYTLLGYYAV
jgi:hypothetical protein